MRALLISVLIAATAAAQTAEETALRGQVALGFSRILGEMNAGTRSKFPQVKWAHWQLPETVALLEQYGITLPEGWTLTIDEYRGPLGIGAIVSYYRQKGDSSWEWMFVHHGPEVSRSTGQGVWQDYTDDEGKPIAPPAKP